MRRTYTLLGVAALLLVSLLGAAPGARAQTGLFFDEYGAGARSGAMGQAFTGIADDASAAYYNPAGIGFAKPQTSLGWRYVDPSLSYSSACRPELVNRPGVCPPVPLPPPPSGPVYIPTPPGDAPRPFTIDFDVKSTQGLQINVVSDLDYDALNEKLPWLEPFQFGGSIFLPLEAVSTFVTYQDPGEPYFFRYGSRPSLFALALGVGYAFTDWLSLGVAVLPNLNSEQNSVSKINLYPEPGDPTNGLDFQILQEGSISIGPVVGILVRPPILDLEELLSIGFSYRGEIDGYFGTGPSQQNFGRIDDGEFHPILSLPDGRIVNFMGYAPAQYTLGVGITPAERAVFDLDVTYKEWQTFMYWVGVKPDPAFQNTWTVRVGGEYTVPVFGSIPLIKTDVTGLAVRLGYYYEPTPVRTLEGRFNILDANQHVVSAGLGIQTRILELLGARLDFIFQAHLLNDRSTPNAEDIRFEALKAEGSVYQYGVEISFDR